MAKIIAPFSLVAADLMKADHPLHGAFVKFCRSKTPTLRQARKFLQKFPQYRKAA